MYLPYLRTKSEEIHALLEMPLNSFDNMLPILEPIGISKLNINKFKKLKDQNIPFILIVNPIINGIGMQKIIDTYINGFLSDYKNYSVAYIINANTTQKEISMFKNIKDLEKSFIHKSEFSNLTFSVNSPVKFHIFQDNKISSNYIGKFLENNNVILTDGFQKLARNADYPKTSLFSDLHLKYNTSFVGISDYLIQGDLFSDSSGGPAVAVAIHLTTSNSNGVYINHFVSDSKEGTGRTAEKFAEALEHLVNFTKENNTPKTSGLEDYYKLFERKHFPGLARNKRIALKNHMEVINKLI